MKKLIEITVCNYCNNRLSNYFEVDTMGDLCFKCFLKHFPLNYPLRIKRIQNKKTGNNIKE